MIMYYHYMTFGSYVIQIQAFHTTNLGKDWGVTNSIKSKAAAVQLLSVPTIVMLQRTVDCNDLPYNEIQSTEYQYIWFYTEKCAVLYGE